MQPLELTRLHIDLFLLDAHIFCLAAILHAFGSCRTAPYAACTRLVPRSFAMASSKIALEDAKLDVTKVDKNKFGASPSACPCVS